MKELDKVTELFKANYAAWKTKTVLMTTGYEYERSFVAMMQEFERDIFALSTGEVPKDKNRKKLHTRFGQLELCKVELQLKIGDFFMLPILLFPSASLRSA